MNKRGKLITLEGGEGSGKTTLLEALQKRLLSLGYAPLVTRAPGATETGKKIRDWVMHQKLPLTKQAELFLFLADRAQHVEELLLPALKEGKIILCDRFNDSTLAYQGAARGENLQFIEKLCLFATQGLTPDLTLYLDIPPEEGLLRAQAAVVKEGKPSYDRIEQEKISFHEKVRMAYRALVEKEPGRIQLIDARQSPEEVFQNALEKVLHLLRERNGGC